MSQKKQSAAQEDVPSWASSILRSGDIEQLLNRGPVVFFLWRIEDGWPVEYASDNVSQFGYTPEDFLSGRVQWPSITHPEDHPRVRAEVAGFLERGMDEFSQHYRLLASDGDVRWVEDTNRVFRDADGAPTHVLGTVWDVTDKVRAAERAARNEASLQSLASNVPGMIYRGDPYWSVTYVLNSVPLCGYPPDVLLCNGVRWTDLVHPDDRERIMAEAERLESKPRERVQEYRIIAKNGQVRWVEDHKRSHFEDGVFAGVDGVVFDVTSRHAAEDALRESEQNFRALAENASAAILIEKADGTNVYANPTAAKMTGYTQAALLGMRASDLIEPRSRARFVRLSALRMAGRRAPRRYETVVLAKDGRRVPVEVCAARTRWRGEPAALGMLNDLTERRRLEQEILDVSDRERESIARNLHDSLGQQLTGISLLASALARDVRSNQGDVADADRVAELAREAVKQARRIAYGLSPVDIGSDGLAYALRGLCRITTEVTGVDCRCIVRTPGIALEPAAAMNVYHVAQEAMNNAIRHGRAGHVTLTLSANRHGRLSVRDDGRGFPKRARKPGGMGLTIMRYRAEMLGGALSIERRASGGVMVVCTFSLP